MVLGQTYSIKQELVAQFANALANPTRVAICEFLSQQKTCYFGTIQEMLPLSKATVSQHLKVLKDAGLIKGEVKPPYVKYSIDKENWTMARDLINRYLSSVLDETFSEEENSPLECSCDNVVDSNDECCCSTENN